MYPHRQQAGAIADRDPVKVQRWEGTRFDESTRASLKEVVCNPISLGRRKPPRVARSRVGAQKDIWALTGSLLPGASSLLSQGTFP